ncbi:DinB superfamily protein [Amycolatopsis tolypomycina]|uniref:DinB superfamily protein n=1 Tax=Amycolatopsis tolypomycina TaxID=208445 RepID=A0A1H4JMA7_9PSEU|nr:DinB family protein [Amycolatopsis tolypomycina]SEB47016.1 DinB superfamily protein [Amycolatopsis tolypomycina]
MDQQAVHEQWEQDRATFHELVAAATTADLHRRSDGTRWTNQQLLFHLVFGYQIVRALLVLVRVFGRLPDPVSRGFAATLNAATRPFHVINYLGSCGGGLIGPDRAARWLDHIIASLHRSLDRADDADLVRRMHYPTRWDPFFQPCMTLADIYRYPARHFAFHQRQLTLSR